VTRIAATGAPVRVRVGVQPDAVEVTVVDAGTGSHPPVAGGVGLVGMRERVAALGGSLEAGPTGDGWRVWARIPRALRPGRSGTPAAPADPVRPPRAAPVSGPTGQSR